MKANKLPIVFLIFVLTWASSATCAEEFLGAPVMPGGDTLKSNKALMEKIYPANQEQLFKFYRDTLKGEKDIKFHVVSGQVYIDEYGSRPWQKVIISKTDNGQTTVLISRDSWTWIIGTLSIRFTGVFVVLLVLYLIMNLAARIISRTIGRTATSRT